MQSVRDANFMRRGKFRSERRWTGVLIALGLLTSTSSAAQTGVVVNALLTELQQTLIAIDRSATIHDLPELSKATIKVKSVYSRVEGGKVSLLVVHLGASVENAQIMEITLELEPPKPGDKAPSSTSADLLTDAIIESLTMVRRAERDEPPLYLSKLTATTGFVVKLDAEGGASFNIFPLGVELGGGVGSEHVHQLTLEFKEET